MQHEKNFESSKNLVGCVKSDYARNGKYHHEKKDANPLRLSIVLSHHMHRN